MTRCYCRDLVDVLAQESEEEEGEPESEEHRLAIEAATVLRGAKEDWARKEEEKMLKDAAFNRVTKTKKPVATKSRLSRKAQKIIQEDGKPKKGKKPFKNELCHMKGDMRARYGLPLEMGGQFKGKWAYRLEHVSTAHALPVTYDMWQTELDEDCGIVKLRGQFQDDPVLYGNNVFRTDRMKLEVIFEQLKNNVRASARGWGTCDFYGPYDVEAFFMVSNNRRVCQVDLVKIRPMPRLDARKPRMVKHSSDTEPSDDFTSSDEDGDNNDDASIPGEEAQDYSDEDQDEADLSGEDDTAGLLRHDDYPCHGDDDDGDEADDDISEAEY